MANSGQPRQLLAGLGITPPEESAYRALLRHGPSTLAELAPRANTSVPALRRILPRLEELGLVSRLPGRPLRLLATSPQIAVDALVASQQEEIARSRAAIELLSAESRTHRGTHPEQVVEIVSGQAAVAQRYLRLLAGAREEFLVLVNPPFAVEASNSSAHQTRSMGQGVRVRGLYSPRAFEDPGTRYYAQRAIAAGEEARVGDVPIKLTIADRRTAMLPLTVEHAHAVDSALVVHPSALLDALITLFEVLWRAAVPVPAENGSAQSDDVLTLLIAGMTDDAIARQLGVSSRTVQRRVRELCDSLGARTRFHAGLLAAERRAAQATRHETGVPD